jgi:hypothetical protein
MVPESPTHLHCDCAEIDVPDIRVVIVALVDHRDTRAQQASPASPQLVERGEVMGLIMVVSSQTNIAKTITKLGLKTTTESRCHIKPGLLNSTIDAANTNNAGQGGNNVVRNELSKCREDLGPPAPLLAM